MKEEFASRVCAKIEVQESVTRLRCVVQSGGTKGLWTQLKALKVEDLRVIAQEIGLPSSGARDAVMKRLFDDISAPESGTLSKCIRVSQAERAETLSKMNKAADSFCAYSCWSVQLGLHGVRALGWDGLHE